MARKNLKKYLKELSMMILGVLIALLIDNYRENIRDEKLADSYLRIVKEDLRFDIVKLTEQLEGDSVVARSLKLLNDVLTTNKDLPTLNYSLAAWTDNHPVPYRDLRVWDSLDYYTLGLYSVSSYTVRKIGFSMIVNSGLSHQMNQNLLQKITVYYTTDASYLDFYTEIDEKCLWTIIPFSNRNQGDYNRMIADKNFNLTELRNNVSGRYNTLLNEMRAKLLTIEKAKSVLNAIEQTT